LIVSSRSNQTFSLLLLILIGAGLACQAADWLGQSAELAPTAVDVHTRQPSLVWTETPSPIPPTSTPSPTRTATPTPAASNTPRPSPPAYQVEVFDRLWTVVKEEYLYRDFNGLDWEAARREFLGRIEAGLSDEAFYAAMDELIDRLDDDHSFFRDPTEVVLEDARYAGKSEFEGIGVLVVPVPARDRAVVLLTLPDSPAALAGIERRDSILTVDGQPLMNPDGVLRDLIRGPDGSVIVLSVQSPQGSPRQVEVTRTSITGPFPLPFEILNTPAGRRIGYVLLPNFSDSTTDEQFVDALRMISTTGGYDGLILDNRWNRGGIDTVLRGTLRLFVEGLLGHFVNANGQRPFLVPGEDIFGSQEIPLVVLVGPDTASFGEIFAGVLQDLGRAYLIGEPTKGNVETMWGYDFVDGSRAWIAHDAFLPLNDPAQDWEQDGVIPDQILETAWEEYPLEEEPVILAALHYFDQ
jgi:C-terminal peptidase prc